MRGPDRTVVHDSPCRVCGAALLQPMAEAILIGRRFLWLCSECQSQNHIKMSRQNAERLAYRFHRAYGMRVSPDEVRLFTANLHRIDEAIATELTV